MSILLEPLNASVILDAPETEGQDVLVLPPRLMDANSRFVDPMLNANPKMELENAIARALSLMEILIKAVHHNLEVILVFYLSITDCVKITNPKYYMILK